MTASPDDEGILLKGTCTHHLNPRILDQLMVRTWALFGMQKVTFAITSIFHLDVVNGMPLMCEIIPTHLPQPVSIPGSSLISPNHYDL